jgi:hypothetical protein
MVTLILEMERDYVHLMHHSVGLRKNDLINKLDVINTHPQDDVEGKQEEYERDLSDLINIYFLLESCLQQSYMEELNAIPESKPGS